MRDKKPPVVFLTYWHGSHTHQRFVRDLANRLRGDGIDASLDQFEQSPIIGWPAWLENQFQHSDFILVIGTTSYLTAFSTEADNSESSRICLWQLNLLRNQLFAQGGVTNKIILAVVETLACEVPASILGLPSVDLRDSAEYTRLLHLLTAQHPFKVAELKTKVTLAPRDAKRTFVQRWQNGFEQPRERLDLIDALDEAYRIRAELSSLGMEISGIQSEILGLRRRLRSTGFVPGYSLLDGRLILMERVGSGGYGEVWKAYDQTRRAVVAIKVLHPQFANDRSRRERFFRGSRKMSELRHRNIVRVNDIELHDAGFYFYSMEYVDGPDLEALVLKQELSSEQGVRIISEIAAALRYAHERGIIHRDVKPGNILIDRNGVPKLTDFDLVKSNDTSAGTRGHVGGTALYIAPENLSHAKAADERSDIYSLGMSLFFVLRRKNINRRVLRDARTEVDKVAIDARLKGAILRAIAWEPIDRFPSMRDFEYALQEQQQARKKIPRIQTRDTGFEALGFEIDDPLDSAEFESGEWITYKHRESLSSRMESAGSLATPLPSGSIQELSDDDAGLAADVGTISPEQYHALSAFEPGVEIDLLSLTLIWQVDLRRSLTMAQQLSHDLNIKFDKQRGSISLEEAFPRYLAERRSVSKISHDFLCRVFGHSQRWRAELAACAYLNNYLPRYLLAAGDREAYLDILFDIDYLAARLKHCGSKSLIDECMALGRCPELSALTAAMQIVAETTLSSKGQLATALSYAARDCCDQSGRISKLLISIASTPGVVWLSFSPQTPMKITESRSIKEGSKRAVEVEPGTESLSIFPHFRVSDVSQSLVNLEPISIPIIQSDAPQSSDKILGSFTLWSRLVVAVFPCEVRVLEDGSMNRLFTFGSAPSRICAFGRISDRALVLVREETFAIEVWDLLTFRVRERIIHHDRPVEALSICGRNRFAALCKDGTLLLFQISNSGSHFHILASGIRNLISIGFGCFASLSRTGYLEVWYCETGDLQLTLPLDSTAIFIPSRRFGTIAIKNIDSAPELQFALNSPALDEKHRLLGTGSPSASDSSFGYSQIWEPEGLIRLDNSINEFSQIDLLELKTWHGLELSFFPPDYRPTHLMGISDDLWWWWEDHISFDLRCSLWSDRYWRSEDDTRKTLAEAFLQILNLSPSWHFWDTHLRGDLAYILATKGDFPILARALEDTAYLIDQEERFGPGAIISELGMLPRSDHYDRTFQNSCHQVEARARARRASVKSIDLPEEVPRPEDYIEAVLLRVREPDDLRLIFYLAGSLLWLGERDPGLAEKTARRLVTLQIRSISLEVLRVAVIAPWCTPVLLGNLLTSVDEPSEDFYLDLIGSIFDYFSPVKILVLAKHLLDRGFLFSFEAMPWPNLFGEPSTEVACLIDSVLLHPALFDPMRLITCQSTLDPADERFAFFLHFLGRAWMRILGIIEGLSRIDDPHSPQLMGYAEKALECLRDSPQVLEVLGLQPDLLRLARVSFQHRRN